MLDTYLIAQVSLSVDGCDFISGCAETDKHSRSQPIFRAFSSLLEHSKCLLRVVEREREIVEYPNPEEEREVSQFSGFRTSKYIFNNNVMKDIGIQIMKVL